MFIVCWVFFGFWFFFHFSLAIAYMTYMLINKLKSGCAIHAYNRNTEKGCYVLVIREIHKIDGLNTDTPIFVKFLNRINASHFYELIPILLII